MLVCGSDGNTINQVYKLDKTITPTPAALLLLKLNKLQLAEWLKNVLQITLRDTKVNIPHIESVERDLVRSILFCRANSGLTVLLCFCKLRDDRDTEKFLPGQLNRLRHGCLIFEFYVTHTVAAVRVSKVQFIR